MVQPKTPPLSIRPGVDRLARIDAYASGHKLSRHLAILLMLDEGYRSLTRAKTLAVAPVFISTRAPDLKVGEMISIGDEPPRRITGVLQVGPIRAKPGERSKKPKGK